MPVGQTFKPDREPDVARSNNILDLKLSELGLKAQLLNDSSVLATGQATVVLRLGSSYDHFARGENECRRLGLTNAHDDGGESLCRLSRVSDFDQCVTATAPLWHPANNHLGIVLSVASVQRNSFQVKTNVEINRGDNIPMDARA